MKNIGPFLAFNKTWFTKNQRLLLFLLNVPILKYWFRWVLRIDTNKQIVEILPNCYTVFNKRKGKRIELTTDFRTHPKYGKRLYYAFRPFWWLVHFWDWAIADRFMPRWSYGFSTLTVFPQAGGGGANTTFDARWEPTSNASWATTRGSASAPFSTTETTTYCRSLLQTGSYFIDRYGATFDTSSIGAAPTISAAELDLNGTGSLNNADSTSAQVVQFAPSVNNNATNTDFATYSFTSFGSIAFASWSTSAYNNITLNASGIANISKTGISKFGVITGRDQGNTAPTGDNLAQFFAADQTGTTNDPKLVITYTLGANTHFLSLLGVGA